MSNTGEASDWTWRVLRAEAADTDPVIELITSVLHEYGETICLEPGGAEHDLLKLGEFAKRSDASFWVLKNVVSNTNQSELLDGQAEQVLGTHAAICKSHEGQRIAIFKRLYLHSQLRGTGAGWQLMQVAIDWAKAKGCQRIEFWSDTRFQRAHRFFAKCGFQATGRHRVMHDSFQPYEEIQFSMPLN